MRSGFVQHQDLDFVEVHGVLVVEIQQTAGQATSTSRPRRVAIIWG
jgi:hypothetical protein